MRQRRAAAAAVSETQRGTEKKSSRKTRVCVSRLQCEHKRPHVAHPRASSLCLSQPLLTYPLPLSRPSLATLASRPPHEHLVRAWMHTAITPSLLSSDPHVRPAAASLAHSLDGRTTLLPLTACRLLFHCPSVLPSGLARLPPPPLLLPPPRRSC